MLKLLLVDDERFTREGLYHDLDWVKIGIGQVELAENGRSALEIMKNFSPNILLTDVKMPKMNGIDLAYRVKEMNPSCSVIFMSGYSDKEYLMSAIEINALNYVEKPINIEELTKSLEKAVSVQNAIEEKKRQIENDTAIKLTSKSSEHYQLINNLKEFIPNFDSNLTVNTLVITNLSRDLFRDNIDFWDQYSTLKGSLNSLKIKHILGIQENKYIIIHVFYEGLSGQDLMEHLVIPTYECIAKALHASGNIYLGVGNTVNDICQAYQSYNTAICAIEDSFFFPSKYIHVYNKYNNGINYSNSDFNLKMISRFADYLDNGDQASSIKMVKTIKNALCKSPKTNINIAFNVFFKLFVELEKRRSLNSVSNKVISNIWSEISNVKSIVDLEDLLISQIEQFFADIHALNSNPIVDNIISIIEKRYSDTGLSLKEISKEIYMSPSYICVLFKKETSKTLSQYINEFRVEKSLNLLKNKQYRVNDVATMVGFENSNYFSKTFKKLKGITPAEYRRRFFGE